MSYRCSDACRQREDPPAATAFPAARLLLVETVGPWSRNPWLRLPPAVAAHLHDVQRSGVRPLLIRRPGRRSIGADLSWAVADTRAEVRAVLWGRWSDPRDLADVDPTERIDPLLAPASGPQSVALVCTHGGRDVCCALRGRPVAATLAALPDLDAWECTHVGGDRFAANLLLLPTGDMFGGLDPDTAVEVVTAFRQGRVDLRRHRGRIGRSALVQAAEHLTATALGDAGRDAVTVVGLEPSPPGRVRSAVATVRHAGRVYHATIEISRALPARLTCSALTPATVDRHVLVALELLGSRDAPGPDDPPGVAHPRHVLDRGGPGPAPRRSGTASRPPETSTE